MYILGVLSLLIRISVTLDYGPTIVTSFKPNYRGASGKEPTCQCRRQKSRGFDPWVRKILWRRAWQPTLIFLRIPWTEEPDRLHGVAKSQRGLKRLNTHTHTHTPLFKRSQIQTVTF